MSKNILIIDDSDTVREQLAQTLEEAGICDQIHQAQDGLEALQHIRAHQNSQVAAIPVIVISSLVMPGDQDSYRNAGANEFLRQPLKASSLAARIENYLKGGL